MWRFLKDTLHPVHMRQPVVAVGTKHCQPVDAVDTKGCCCNTCFGRFHRLVYPQHRISKGVADYLSEVSQSSKAEWWIYMYFVLWLGILNFDLDPERVIKYNTRGPFYHHGLTLIPAWISNHMPRKVWAEITYPFPNFNGCTVEFWELITNFIPLSIMDPITHPCWD